MSHSNLMIDPDSIALKIRELDSIPLPPGEKTRILKLILSLIDLTTLEGTDNEARINSLCNKAILPATLNLPFPAAVCVYPPFVRIAKKQLSGTSVRVASVAGAFPSGQSPLHVRVEEVKYAVDEGADEIDMVISRGKFLEGNDSFVTHEIEEIKKAAGNSHLKVILETGEIGSLMNIRKASQIAIEAGADFIKTSTGKVSPAATTDAVWVMAETVRDHFQKSGKKIGIKPAGGISTADQAVSYIRIIRHLLGEEWLYPGLFRFGASRLFDNILKEFE